MKDDPEKNDTEIDDTEIEIDDTEIIADAIAAVAGTCDARQIPAAEWSSFADVIAELGLLAGASHVDVRGALRLGDGASVAASYFIFVATGDTPGIVGGDTSNAATTVRHLVRADLGADFGRVFMRPESLGDKISESYNRIEVDFDAHPGFSDRYYVLAEDEVLFRDNVTAALLDAIGEIDGLVIEIAKGTLTATFERAVTVHDAVALSRLAIVAAVR
jgi:hypothetical protein